MNTISIAGNIAKDAEIRYTTSGDPVCNFSVADNQGKDKEAIFWNCGLYGKRVEALSKYLVKGQAITIAGSISTNKYTDKNGVDRVGYNVRVNELALQGGKKDEKPQERAVKAEAHDDIPFN